jgi:hypothetical protein
MNRENVLDDSHLQLPFKLKDTVDTFLNALEDGTNEAKYLLTKECDLLLECKVNHNRVLVSNLIGFQSLYVS